MDNSWKLLAERLKNSKKSAADLPFNGDDLGSNPSSISQLFDTKGSSAYPRVKFLANQAAPTPFAMDAETLQRKGAPHVTGSLARILRKSVNPGK